MKKRRILIPVAIVSLVLSAIVPMLALPRAAHAAVPAYHEVAEGKTEGGTTCIVDVSGFTLSAGDLLIGILSTDGGSETHSSPENDAWNDILVDVTEGNITFSCWWKTAHGGETSLIFGVGSSEDMYAMVLRVTGHNTSTPIDSNSASANGGSTTATCPDILTQHDNELILRMFGSDQGDVTVDGGWQSVANISVDCSRVQSNACSGGVGEEDQASQGQTGTETNTLTDSEEWIAFTVGIREYAAVVLPTVTSSAATDVTTFSAELNGEVTATGGENCDERGFVWGDNSLADPGNVAPTSSGYDSYYTDSGSHGTGTFSYVILDLNPQTTMYFRAYAHNSVGYEYSDAEQSFLTIPRMGTGLGPTGTVL